MRVSHRLAAALILLAACFCYAERTGAKPLEAEDFTTVLQLREAGWRIGYPPYPAEARMQHEDGDVFLCITTDANGRVAKITIPEKPESAKSEPLRKNALSYVRANWVLAPNATFNVKVGFHLTPVSR